MRVQIICVRDPDAENEYAIFGGGRRSVPGTFLTVRPENDPLVEVTIHDVDLGRADLTHSEEVYWWVHGHLAAAARMEREAATHLTEIVTAKAKPRGGIRTCPACAQPRAAMDGSPHAEDDACPWCRAP